MSPEITSQHDDIQIHVIDREGILHDLEIPSGITLNLMEACTAFELPINSICGGLGLCGNCHVYILSDHILKDRSEQEEETLDKLGNINTNSRLACQIPCTDQIHGLRFQLAPVD